MEFKIYLYSFNAFRYENIMSVSHNLELYKPHL